MDPVQGRGLVSTYWNDHCLPKAVLVLLCQVKYLTTLSTRIQLSSIDLHYRAKYFWHLTKISNIKEQHIQIITNKIQLAIVTHIKSTFCIWLPYFVFKSQWIIGSGLHS